MAVPVSNSVARVGDPRIDGLVQGSSWRFGSGPPTLTYSLNIAFDTQLSPGKWTDSRKNAVADAFEAWSAVADLNFVRTGGVGTQLQNQSTADIAISLERLGPGAPFLGIGVFPSPSYASKLLGELGYSRNSGQFPYPRPEGDIAFVSDHPSFHSVKPGSVGYTAILHEIGHALGLKHPDDDGANSRPTFDERDISELDTFTKTVMSSKSFRLEHVFPATPMPLDILAIQRIYGANMAYRTGDDVYNVRSDRPLRTIWDAGGTDTLVVSGEEYREGAFPTTISLKPGGLSDLGSDRPSSAIAYNVVIENAIGGPNSDRILGNSANNNLSGGGGDDRIDGGGGNDTISGGDGSDTLTGNAGSDMLTGGTGDDVFNVDSTGDVVAEQPLEGVDTVRSPVSLVLPDHVEHLKLTGKDAIGGTGNGAVNTLIGNDANNRLDGGPGFDVLRGGKGDDTYVLLDTGASTFVYFERPELPPNFTRPPIEATTLYRADTPGVFSESRVFDLEGDGLGPALLFVFFFDEEGDDSARLTLRPPDGLAPGTYTYEYDHTGDKQIDLVVSDASIFRIDGSVTIEALELDHSASTPTIQRLLLVFDLTLNFELPAHGAIAINHPAHVAADMIVEDAGAGTDTVETPLSYRLPANVENLTLTGSDDVNGTGNALDNVLTGNSGLNILAGGAGNDIYVIQNAGDVVVENADEGIDTLVTPFTTSLEGSNIETLTLTGADDIDGTGTSGQDVLTGNGGINTLTGGAGDDTYVIQNAGDVIVENADEGSDTVAASISYSLAETHIENLTLVGSEVLTATGNALNNTLTGNSAASTLAGGTGDDTYVVTNLAQIIVEDPEAGFDRVQSAVSYRLGDNVEDLGLTGSGNINGTGNALANNLTGNSAANILDGRGGVDTLNGGGGNDTLVWSALDEGLNGGSGVDTLRVDGGGKTLNLRTVANDTILNVEVIDIRGSGKNRLELVAQDVIDLSSSTNTLRVEGNTGDVVDRNIGWAQGADRMIGANTYHSYTQGLATLLVDTNITSVV